MIFGCLPLTQTTIRSVIFLWNSLNSLDGFSYLNLRAFNQDPLENLFSSIRQHGAANTNPTCHQFTAALKTVVVNKLVSPTNVDRNCEADRCAPLDDLLSLLKTVDNDSSKFSSIENRDDEDDEQSETLLNFNISELDDLPPEDVQGLAYVAGWVLKNINVPDCQKCHNILYSSEVTNRHLLTSFREVDCTQKLTYASELVMSLLKNIHDCLYEFLETSGFQRNLEDTFKNLFKQNVSYSEEHCTDHDSFNLILDRCTPFLIFKFCRDKHKRKRISDGHVKKMKKLKVSRV
ncbi:hypothetical protein Zmor_020562 [Zophobas morio]|uniref:Transposable element P transposase-like RNase H C-terminal domain-containing protein n=1 Tax=Zophobas morio TaxID=2755281 RepID=A0AA38MA50_9CUCU|nr:hypothetical protein Zmor_020562 [Zophobas morio]